MTNDQKPTEPEAPEANPQHSNDFAELLNRIAEAEAQLTPTGRQIAKAFGFL
jgi:hypothetical protein